MARLQYSIILHRQMQLSAQLDLLHKQLNIPSDKFNRILPTLCQNFLKKYKTKSSGVEVDVTQLRDDVREIGQCVDVYSQWVDAYDTIGKYGCLERLEQLVRGIVDTQGAMLDYFGGVVGDLLKQKCSYESKLDAMTSKVYERCQNCQKPLRRAQIEGVQDEIGLRFRDLHEYFLHDMDQINKLSQQASLLFRKKMLNIEGIAQQQYMQKFTQMYQNVTITIDHVTSSLNSITKFQDRIAELNEHQYNVSQTQGKWSENKFDGKRYVINLGQHFGHKIAVLEGKINKIRSYFVTMRGCETQTENNFNDYTPEKIQELKREITLLEADKKQAQIYSTIVQKQMKQDKMRFKTIENSYFAMKAEKEKGDQRVRALQLEIQLVKESKRIADKMMMDRDESEKKVGQAGQNYPGKVAKFAQQSKRQQVKSMKKIKTKKLIQGEPQQSNNKEQSRNQRSKKHSKYSNSNINPIKRDQQEDSSAKGERIRHTSKIKTDIIDGLMEMTVPERKIRQFAQTLEGSNYKFNRDGMIVPIKQLSETNSKKDKRDFKQESFGSYEKSRTQGEEVSSDQTFSLKQKNQFSFKDMGYNNVLSMKIMPTTSTATLSKPQNHKKQNTMNFKQKMIQKFAPAFNEASSQAFKDNQPRSQEHFIQQIYNLKSRRINKVISFSTFKDKIETVLQEILGNKNYSPRIKQKQGNLENSDNDGEFTKTKQKIKSLSKFSRTAISQSQMKTTTKNGKYWQGNLKQSQPSPTQGPEKSELASLLIKNRKRKHRSKINTQTNYQQIINSINKRDSIRKSIDVVEDTQGSKFILKLQKLNIFSNTDALENRSVLDSLPMLKKGVGANGEKTTKEGLHQIQPYLQQQILAMIEENLAQALQFTVRDIKIVYNSIETAYQLGRVGLKHRKSQSCILTEQDLLHSCQINYIKQVFTRLASIHLSNPKFYQKIKLFLIAPYDSVVTQMTDLKILKLGHSSNVMRQALKKIILLHRQCTTKGELCKHLRYLLAKMVYLEGHGNKDKQGNKYKQDGKVE